MSARGNKAKDDVKEKSRLTKEEWREYTKTVWHIANTSHPVHPATFPLEIPKRLIKLFSFYGEVVLDPFAGTGVTAEAALALGRRSINVEQNLSYSDLIKARLREQSPKGTASQADVVCGDSRELMWLEAESVDLVVTSPPYWNKADYGAGVSNLGNVAGYTDFLAGIAPVFRECLRVLKEGRKLCVVTANVNQYTDRGLLTFPLAADFVVMLRSMGFVMMGEVIWSKDGTGGRWGSWGAQRPIFGSYPYPPNFLFKTVHEHILILAKPSTKKIASVKALPYDELMGVSNSVQCKNGSHKS